MAEDSKQRMTVIAVCSVILVAMVVALTVGSMSKTTEDKRPTVSQSTKAIKTICDSTDYKDVCINSLNSTAGNSTDPKELIEAAFQVTIKHLQDAVNKSILLQNLEKDPRTKLALENCQELGERAVSDLQNSFSMFQSFDFNNLKDMLNDMKVWISGALTYQETCLDGFEDTTGDAGQKMSDVLKIGMQMTSNGLAMITDVSSVITSLDILPSFRNRRLLSDVDLDLPDWLDTKSRRLLQDVSPVNVTNPTPNLIVAKDGSGNYTNINDAIKAIPIKSNETFVLYIKEGVYKEKVQFFRNLTHLMVIGDGPTKTRITGSLNFIDGTPTYHTATVVVLGEYFIAKDIGFENSAGAEKHQAVALRVGADKSIFYNCHMDGYQDTLYAHTYRQFYRNCVISGTIDFVFGDSAAIFQNCTFMVRKPLDNQQCIVTAQGRKDVRQPTGLVLQHCNIVADEKYHPLRKKIKSYLGRPWKEYSRTIIMESNIDDLIQPEGWLPWEGSFALDTLFYTEFNNRGPGSVKSHRVKWPGLKELQANRVQRYTASRFIEAETWIPASGVPFDPDFILPVPKDNKSVTYSPIEPEEVKDLGLPKEENNELVNGSLNLAPVALPPPSTLGTGTAPSPAPYANDMASPPMQGGVSPSAAPFGSVASPPSPVNVGSPAPAPSTASPPSPSPFPGVASPPAEGLTPSSAPTISPASPPAEGGSPPAPTPENAASPPAPTPENSVSPPAPTPTPTDATSPPTEATTPPAPTPETAASPPAEATATTPPAPTPENAASPPAEATTPPAPTPESAASPPAEATTPPVASLDSIPAEGTTLPAPTPENAAASPPPAPTSENAGATPPSPVEGTTLPAPTPESTVAAATPPTPSAPTPEIAATPPSPTTETTATQDVNSASPPSPTLPTEAGSTAPSPSISGAESSTGATVDSQTSLPASSPSMSPSSQ